MKTVISGPRTIQLFSVVSSAITAAGFTPTEVFSSMESGPPIMAYRWATERKIPVRPFQADWKRLGKPAGIIRDREMITYADAVILIWDGVDWMTEAMRKYCGFMNPPVKLYLTIFRPDNTTTSLIQQGRDASLLL